MFIRLQIYLSSVMADNIGTCIESFRERVLRTALMWLKRIILVRSENRNCRLYGLLLFSWQFFIYVQKGLYYVVSELLQRPPVQCLFLIAIYFLCCLSYHVEELIRRCKNGQNTSEKDGSTCQKSLRKRRGERSIKYVFSKRCSQFYTFQQH